MEGAGGGERAVEERKGGEGKGGRGGREGPWGRGGLQSLQHQSLPRRRAESRATSFLAFLSWEKLLGLGLLKEF